MKTKRLQQRSPRYRVALEQELERAKGRVRKIDCLSAGVTLLIGALAYGLVMIVLDHWLNFSDTTRQILLGCFGVAAVGYLIYALVLPLRRQVNPYYAARALEKTLPESKNALVNWLDLRNEPLPPVIRDAVQMRAASEFEEADVEDAIPSRRPVYLAAAAAGLLVVLFISSFFLAGKFGTLLQRTFFPFGAADIPTQTRLYLVAPIDDRENNQSTEIAVEPNRPVTIAVQVDGKVPEDGLDLEYRDSLTEKPSKLPFPRPPGFEEGSSVPWTVTLSSDKITAAGLWFQARGGDGATRQYRLVLKSRNPPTVSEILATYQYPEYTKRPPREQFQGRLQGLLGTKVKLEITADQPLKSGELEIQVDGQPFHTAKLDLVSKPGNDNDRGRLVTRAEEPLVLSADLMNKALYRVKMLSTEGKEAFSPSYPITVEEDGTPQVDLDKINQEELKPEQNLILLPANAVVPVEGKAYDDLAVMQARLRLRLLGTKDKPENRELFLNHQRAVEKFNPKVTGLRPSSTDYQLTLDLKNVTDSDEKDAKPLTFQPGQILELWVEVIDNCEPKAKVGESRTIQIELQDPLPEEKRKEQEKNTKQQQQKHDQRKKDKEREQNPQDPTTENNPPESPDPTKNNNPNKDKKEQPSEGKPCENPEGNSGEGRSGGNASEKPSEPKGGEPKAGENPGAAKANEPKSPSEDPSQGEGKPERTSPPKPENPGGEGKPESSQPQENPGTAKPENSNQPAEVKNSPPKPEDRPGEAKPGQPKPEDKTGEAKTGQPKPEDRPGEAKTGDPMTAAKAGEAKGLPEPKEKPTETKANAPKPEDRPGEAKGGDPKLEEKAAEARGAGSKPEEKPAEAKANRPESKPGVAKTAQPKPEDKPAEVRAEKPNPEERPSETKVNQPKAGENPAEVRAEHAKTKTDEPKLSDADQKRLDEINRKLDDVAKGVSDMKDAEARKKALDEIQKMLDNGEADKLKDLLNKEKLSKDQLRDMLKDLENLKGKQDQLTEAEKKQLEEIGKKLNEVAKDWEGLKNEELTKKALEDLKDKLAKDPNQLKDLLEGKKLSPEELKKLMEEQEKQKNRNPNEPITDAQKKQDEEVNKKLNELAKSWAEWSDPDNPRRNDQRYATVPDKEDPQYKKNLALEELRALLEKGEVDKLKELLEKKNLKPEELKDLLKEHQNLVKGDGSANTPGGVSRSGTSITGPAGSNAEAGFQPPPDLRGAYEEFTKKLNAKEKK